MRKVLSILLTLALCIGLMPAVAVPVHADSHTHEGWTAWSTTDALPTEAGNYYLTVDVTLSGVQDNSWRAPAGTTSICLEGHTIGWYNSKYPNYSRNIMRVYDDAILHIYDKEDNSGKITNGAAGGNGSYGAHWNHGGGVFIDGGQFYLHGGTICENSAYGGGGVYVCNSGQFIMSGGVISDNQAGEDPWYCAAGVQVENKGIFTMTGGTITNNHGPWNNVSYYSKWGVFVNAQDCQFNVSGNPVINGNVGSGGERNVYLGDGAKINVIGALTENAKIGVATWNNATDGNPITVTSGLSSNGSLSNFICNQNTWNTDANNAFRLTGGEVEAYYATPYDVTITPGANMTKTTDSGTASQTGVIGPMSDVIYTADTGYYFPTDYSVASVNGISVTRNSDSQITVSGTPEADTEITLQAAIAIPVVYDLYIGGVQVTEANTSGIGWSYDPDTSTLSLNNYTFTGTGYGEDVSCFTYIAGEKHGAIFSKLDDLTISLTGTNTVTEAGGAYFSCGIFSTGAVTIDGDGSLSLSGGTSTKNVSNEPSACGVFATSLTVDAKGSVSITAGDNTKKGYSYGVFLKNGLTINQGSVSITAGASADRSYGLSCGDVAINNATVTITAREGYNSYGLYCSSLAVNASDVTVSVSAAQNQQRALGVAKTKCSFGTGVTAEVSNNIDGTDLMPFEDGDVNTVKYFKTTYVAPPPTYDVTVSAGTGMTLTSGTESQTGLSGAMTDVVYTANEGYYFPDPYSSAGTKTGVTVTRDSYTQITVFGTPTANTTIDLDPATAKTKLPTPAATFALDGDSNLVISGLVDGTTYRVGFPDGGAADFAAKGSQLTLSGIIAGNYNIKALATGTDANEHVDSDPEKVTITKAAAPTGVGKTDCTTAANNDGTITGVDNTMEYQKSGDAAWTAVTGTSVTGLVPGTYSVRIATAGTALASDAVSVTIAEYTPPKADTPVFTPGAQTFTDSLDVTISIPDGATVYYTTDGKDPDKSSTVTTGAAITLNETTTLKAFAVKDGFTDSDIAEATYTKEESAPTPSGGGGGATMYEVKPAESENGKVTVSPKNAAEGDEVTVTVTPNDGYELDKLVVKDKDGNEIEVTEKDGKYTFTMPASEVEITAEFKEAEPETPATDGFPFVDVPEDAYFRKAVEWALENGVTGGTSPTTFSPKAQATRGQTMTFLWAAAGAPEPKTTENSFKDISESDYYYKAILWAYENGITAGISADEFGPEITVTRAQVATFLYGIAGRPDAGSEPFTDVSEGDYFEAPVAWAYKEGITTGTSETTFSPDADCLREQIITFMYLYFGAE